ncbi:MAG: hypothetical protein AAGB10_20080 [Pseudomonadota bacterium]
MISHPGPDDPALPGSRHRASPKDYHVLKDIGTVPSAADRALLLHLYDEVGTQWRDLHAMRFKLLGLLPLVSVGLFSFGAATVDNLPRALGAALVAGLGLLVTQGLHVYDRRNSELYDDLISRGRRIEAELGIDVGVYRGRKRPARSGINHGVATGTIYWSVKLAWGASLLLAVAVAARLAKG